MVVGLSKLLTNGGNHETCCSFQPTIVVGLSKLPTKGGNCETCCVDILALFWRKCFLFIDGRTIMKIHGWIL